MSDAFFKLYDNQKSLSMELGHNSIADWCLAVYDKKATSPEEKDKPIVFVQDCDINFVLAKGYVDLAEYLSDKRGGY